MRVLLRVVSIGLVLTVGTLALQAQAIRGPVIGFVTDGAGSALRPLLGVPGASSVGEPLALDVGVRKVQVSPKQDYFLALSREDKSVVLFDLNATTLSARFLSFPGIADFIAISPSGSAAAIYDAVTQTVYAIGGLPSSPGAVRSFNASELLGQVAGISVTDDAALAMVRSETSEGEKARIEFSVLSEKGGPWRVPTADAAVS